MNSQKVYRILKNGKLVNSLMPGKFAGHKVLKIFARLDCWSGKHMKKTNRVFFHTVEDAIQQGYRPCKNCRPLDEKSFTKVKHLVGYSTLIAFYEKDKKKKRKKHKSNK